MIDTIMMFSLAGLLLVLYATITPDGPQNYDALIGLGGIMCFSAAFVLTLIYIAGGIV